MERAVRIGLRLRNSAFDQMIGPRVFAVSAGVPDGSEEAMVVLLVFMEYPISGIRR